MLKFQIFLARRRSDSRLPPSLRVQRRLQFLNTKYAPRHCGNFGIECGQQSLYPTAWNAARDEDHAAAPIIRRPAGQPVWRMKHVLDAVNDGGPLRAFQDVHNALETEEIGATVLRDRFEKSVNVTARNGSPRTKA